MGRHRHAVNVRVDGIAVVLGPLLSDARITAATLVDVDSGMVLDAWSAAGGRGAAPDLEMIGAQHAEVVRCALALLREWPHPAGPEADTCEIVLGADDGVRHLVRTVPDPYGDRLALAVVVDGPQRVLERVRRRFRSVAVDALTAGPSVVRRPVLGSWSFAMPGPDVPARPEGPADPAAGSTPAASTPATSTPAAGTSAAGMSAASPVAVQPAAVGPARTEPHRPADGVRRPSPPVALPAAVPPRQRDR